ncbi:MAG: aldo/keto reductase [Lachnospiraceae bacterium]|nr:aldo/keto reductase [Lachnospiraceae bacterium]
MIYRNNNGNNDLSALGFGCMRFKKKGNGFDMEEVEKEIMYAIEKGVNYFDTAYIYAGSEQALGQIISKNKVRDRINIATKLPHYMMRTREEMDKYFSEQLERLKTDYIDYYLMHMLPDRATWDSLVKRGALEWLLNLKSEGKIRNIGFSYHGSSEGFIDILNAYDWDFCQIQYNYMDENSQAGRRGLLAAAQKGIPVIIMEPLRGGRLANDLPKEAMKVINESDRGYSPAEWSFRWLWDQKEVSVVLSGMNTMEMLDENIRIASEAAPGSLTQEDHETIEKIRKGFEGKIKIPCTGCAYCMPCPRGVDIPGCFRSYNVSYTDNYFNGFREFFMNIGMKKEPSVPSKCIECGKCETHCPQGIKIRDELKNVKKRFENPIYKIAAWFVSKRFK